MRPSATPNPSQRQAWRTLLRAFGHVRLVPFGLRDRLIRRVAPPGTISGEFETGFFGMRYRGRLENFIDWSTYFYGAYELPELELMRTILERISDDGPIVIDVGGNVGHHSMFFSRHARAVHAFEPWPVVADQFEAHLRDNDIRNVFLHRFALGAADAIATYHAPDGANLAMGSFAEGNSDENRVQLELPIRNGDAVMRELQIATSHFIKIDVEGWELDVLLGLRAHLNEARPVLAFEYSEATRRRATPRAIGDALPHGYQLFEIARARGDKARLVPFSTGEHFNLLGLPIERTASMRDLLTQP
jgi:FkbM family methyltransferase